MRVIATNKPIKLQIDDLKLTLVPLKYAEKSELFSEYTNDLESSYAEQALDRLNFNTLKRSIKDVEGLVDQDGDVWLPEFDDGTGYLSDRCLEDLLGLEVRDSLVRAVTAFLNGFPKNGEIVCPLTKQVLPNVKILTSKNDDLDTKKK